MKYSNWIGIALIGLLFWACTQVWASFPGDKYVGGLFNKGNDTFGKPGLMHFIMCVPALLMFIIPRLWAKRTNVFLAAINLAWAIANFYKVGVACDAGICPERHAAIYMMLFASIGIMAMALFPRVEIKPKN